MRNVGNDSIGSGVRDQQISDGEAVLTEFKRRKRGKERKRKKEKERERKRKKEKERERKRKKEGKEMVSVK